MGICSHVYVKRFVCRYDKEVGVPYFSYKDFKGFKREEFSFNNSLGIEIHCFYYYYDNYKEDKIVMFCHGLGPGHVSYLAEIEALARHGYKVLALDYTGCGESEGDNMGSINAPARDIDELLDYLKLDKPVILVGHSLGGFSALKIASIRKEINKVVVFAPIILFKPMILAASKSKFITHFILKYERKVGKQYDAIDLTAYLKSTEDKIFFIQSEDDPMVPYETSLKIAEEANNPNIQTYVDTANYEFRKPRLSVRLSLFKDCFREIKPKNFVFAEHTFSLLNPNIWTVSIIYAIIMKHSARYYFFVDFKIVILSDSHIGTTFDGDGFYKHMGALFVDSKPRKVGDKEYMENVYLHNF